MLAKAFSFSFFFSTLVLGNSIHEKVLICGVCRNVESRLEKTKAIMESIGDLFDDYRIVVYENNSSDLTAEMLINWSKENPKVDVTCETLSHEDFANLFINRHADQSFFVPEQIARARNKVLDKALSQAYEDFRYLIWMDMDFVLPPNLEGFIDTFHCDQEWDAVFAYGIDPDEHFWDWYAFRDQNYPLGSELLGMHWWYMPKHIVLTSSDPWYPVYSAFGGCGIYKKTSIIGCRYDAIVTQDLEIHARKLIEIGERQAHPQINDYLEFCKHLEAIYTIEEPKPNLPYRFNLNSGILLRKTPDALLWRLSSFVYQYPSVCEHVPFHASMILKGHDKLFINPKLVFRYGG